MSRRRSRSFPGDDRTVRVLNRAQRVSLVAGVPRFDAHFNPERTASLIAFLVALPPVATREHRFHMAAPVNDDDV